MLESCGGLGLATKTLRRLRVAQLFGVKNLDRHRVANKQSCRSIDGGHAALTDSSIESVFALDRQADARVRRRLGRAAMRPASSSRQ